MYVALTRSANTVIGLLRSVVQAARALTLDKSVGARTPNRILGFAPPIHSSVFAGKKQDIPRPAATVGQG